MTEALFKIKKLILKHQHGSSFVEIQRIEHKNKTELYFIWDKENVNIGKSHFFKKIDETDLIDFLFQDTSIKKRSVFFDKLDKIEVENRIEKLEKSIRETIWGFYGDKIL